MNDSNTPYANLDPSLILNAIEHVGYRCTGNLFALNSFENRVYQIGIEDLAPIIAKFYRPHRWSDEAILEEHRFALELAEYEIPVVAPLVSANGETLHHFENFRFALFPRQGARIMEINNLEHLEIVGRFIGRIHAVAASSPFQHRLKLDAQSYGYLAYDFLINNNFIPASIKNEFCTTIESALKKVEENFQRVGPVANIRLHGDCHVGNILWHNDGPHIVDLDDCLMGPAVQDIWMLVSGNAPQEMELHMDRIMHGYQQFHDFNYRELHLIESLRTLRMIHYSAWLAKRWNDPAFPINFPWFNTFHYWQEQLHQLNEQNNLLAYNSP